MPQLTARRAVIPNEEMIRKLRMLLGGGVVEDPVCWPRTPKTVSPGLVMLIKSASVWGPVGRAASRRRGSWI